MPEAVIVVPPFMNSTGPPLGAELVAAACRAQGLGCDVLYANLTFAAAAGEVNDAALIMVTEGGAPANPGRGTVPHDRAAPRRRPGRPDLTVAAPNSAVGPPHIGRRERSRSNAEKGSR